MVLPLGSKTKETPYWSSNLVGRERKFGLKVFTLQVMCEVCGGSRGSGVDVTSLSCRALVVLIQENSSLNSMRKQSSSLGPILSPIVRLFTCILDLKFFLRSGPQCKLTQFNIGFTKDARSTTTQNRAIVLVERNFSRCKQLTLGSRSKGGEYWAKRKYHNNILLQGMHPGG